MRRLVSCLVVGSVALSGISACSPSGKTVANEPAPVKAPQREEAPAVSNARMARLLQPEKLREMAPQEFTVEMKTTKGNVKIAVYRDWAPDGADRFYNLVKSGFFRDIAMFRMVKGFVVQFGIHGSPLVSSVWRDATIADDAVKETNARGTLTFAKAGPDTRTTQLFINLQDNPRLDAMGFAPIGKIVEGMDVIDAMNFSYGERPNQARIQREGNDYLKKSFPGLDYIESINIL